MIPHASGLSSLVSDVDLLLVDVWGVLHNGVSAHVAAGEALQRFRAQGGFVALVSNAPRVASFVTPFLDRIGVPRAAYDAVVTSGDVARATLARSPHPSLLYIGPDKDRALFAGLPMRETGVEEATLALCAGLANDETETPDDYAALLARCAARDLPMLCANPDLVVERGQRLIWCAGSIAERYAAMGGRVTWTGKPHRAVYDAAFDIAALTRGRPVDPARALAIGDAIRTDIAGARGVGVRSLLIADGIHARDLLDARGAIDGAKAETFLNTAAATPDATMARLRW